MLINKKYSDLLHRLFPLLLFFFCFCFKLFFIEKRDISIDEPFSIFHAQQSLKYIFNLSASGEPNPPLFLLLLHFWIKLFGNDVIAVRLMPLIFNALTSVIIYQTGRKYFTEKVGITSALIFIFSFYHFFHGLECRTYALFVMAASLSLYCFLKAIQTKNNKTIIGLTLSNVLLVYSHYFGWFLVFTQFIIMVILWNDRTILKRVSLAISFTMLAFVPMLRIIINQFKLSNKGTWLEPPVIRDYLKEIIMLFNDKMVILVLGIIVIVGALLIKRTGTEKLKIQYLIAFLWWFVPYTLMFIISFKLPVFNSRYILFTSVGLYLFVSALISLFYRSNKYLEFIALSLVIILMSVKLRILPDDFGKRDIKNIALFVKQEEKKLNDPVIILYPKWSDLPFMYYYDRGTFSKPYNFYQNCSQKNIFTVWNSENAKEIISHHLENDVIMIIDKSEEEAGIFFKIMNTTHTQLNFASFAETYNVGIFKSN